MSTEYYLFYLLLVYRVPIILCLFTILNVGFFYFFPQLKWFRESFYYELL